MFYKHARFILSMLGVVIGITGYYLQLYCPVGHERSLLWIGSTLVFSIGGFIIGRIIETLSIRSHTDYLTGLWNRRYFHLKLREIVGRINKDKGQLCIAMIDVDGFKKINDLYGHVTGDVLLCGIAAILKEGTSNNDIVIRLGGDEFAVVFTETNSLKNALEIMERIRRRVENTFLSYHLTISTGIISLEQEQDVKDLLIKADQTLYKAKEQKNAVIGYKW